MSLTSYRAAPPRDNLRNRRIWPGTRVASENLGIRLRRHRKRDTLKDFTRFGGDLLSHALRRSTIGAKALNGRVRDGTGCFALAMTTKPRKIHELQVEHAFACTADGSA